MTESPRSNESLVVVNSLFELLVVVRVELICGSSHSTSVVTATSRHWLWNRGGGGIYRTHLSLASQWRVFSLAISLEGVMLASLQRLRRSFYCEPIHCTLVIELIRLIMLRINDSCVCRARISVLGHCPRQVQPS